MSFSTASYSALPILLCSHVVASVTATFDFNSEGANDYFSDSVTGWTQDSANPVAFGNTFPLAYISSTNFGGGPSNSGHLGTQFGNTADNSSTTVSGTFSPVAGGTGTIPSVTLNLAILDDSSDSFTGTDTFTVGVQNSADVTIAQIEFTPNGGNWLVNGSSGISILPNSGYEFKINFAADQTTYLWGNANDGAFIVFDTAPAVAGAYLAGIEMTHIPVASAGSSANTLVFDNIVATVPEPSALALFILGLPLLNIRRRG